MYILKILEKNKYTIVRHDPTNKTKKKLIETDFTAERF